MPLCGYTFWRRRKPTGGGTPTPTPSITAPVISQTSTTGANPFLWTVAENATFFPGYFWDVQTATGASEVAAAIALAAGTTNDEAIQAIEPGDLSGTDPIVFPDLGSTSLSGPIALRLRVGSDDGLGGYNYGPWSNILTDTLAAISTATLATGSGVNKSQYIDVTGTPKLTATMNAQIGLTCCVRTTTAPTGQRHFEVTINSVGTSGLIAIGLADSAVALGAAVFTGPNAGGGSVAGCSVTFSGAFTTIYCNGGSTGGTTPTLTTGDVIVVDFDTAANTVTFDHKRGGTVTSIASLTLTSNIPTNWTAYVGGSTNDGSGDSVTVNFGATPFASTTGYSIYG